MDEWVGGTMTIGVVDLDGETTIDEETAIRRGDLGVGELWVLRRERVMTGISVGKYGCNNYNVYFFKTFYKKIRLDDPKIFQKIQ